MNVSKPYVFVIFNWYSWQIIGRSFGKEGPMQPLLKLELDLVNRLSNPGTDGVLSVFPFLRFLPLTLSSIYHDAKSVHQKLLDILEMLSVMYIFVYFQSFLWIKIKYCDMSFWESLIICLSYYLWQGFIQFIFFLKKIFTFHIFENSIMTILYRYICLLHIGKRLWKDRDISLYERNAEWKRWKWEHMVQW